MMNDIDIDELEVDDEEEDEVMNATNSTTSTLNSSSTTNSIANSLDSNNQSPQSIQSIATQAAAAMAAAMAAQQLLASATAICGIDLASLSNFALMAGQPPSLNGANHPTPEQLMAAAVATAAFLSPNHLVPQDLTVNQSSSVQSNGGGSNEATAQSLGGGAGGGGLFDSGPLSLTAASQHLFNHSNNSSNNNNGTSNTHNSRPNHQAGLGSAVGAQVSPQQLLASNPADLLALELANHLRMQQQQQQQQQHQQSQPLQLHQHTNPLHLAQQQQQQQQQQTQQQQPQQMTTQNQQQPQQNHHHNHHGGGAHHHLLGAHHNHGALSQVQPANQNHHTNHNARHHHLLGGHHHHSSIQTQQQLLATNGYNPMAVVKGSGQQTEILTPTHLRKAKLMFFYVRYPNSSTLKECFRDVRFNKNNTAQLVKWFSNFREFYYIQMEKFARDAVADDRIQCKEDIVVSYDHELINQLNNHYNKNRHIELPEVFRQVVEETLRHFFDAIHQKRDQEQSWKKAIYKLIARLDQEVPEVFKTDAFNEHLE